VALHDEQAVVAVGELHGVDHPAGDHQVVAVLEVDVAQEGAQGAAALVHEDHLIAVGVLVEVVHALGLRRGEHDGAVAVHQHGLARGQVVLLGLGLEAMQPQRAHVLLDRRSSGVTSFGLRSSFTIVGRWVW
jgi:hypothetical protein